MFVSDLIKVCNDEGLDMNATRVVIGFVGGTTFNVAMVDGSEAGDNETIYLTLTEEVSR